MKVRIISGALAALTLLPGAAQAQCGEQTSGARSAATLVAQTVACNVMAYSSTAGLLATGDCLDGVAQIISTRTGQRVAALRHGNFVARDLAFSPDGSLLYSRESTGPSSSDQSALRLWEPNTGDERITLPTLNSASSDAEAEFSPNGRRLAVPLLASVEIFNVDGASASFGAHIGSAPSRNGESWTGFAGLVRFSADGRWLYHAYSRGGENPAIINVTQSGRTGETIALAHSLQTPRINDVALSPDGRRLASAAEDGAIHVWDVEPDSPTMGREITTLRGPELAATQVGFLRDDDGIAAIFRSSFTATDGALQIWNVQTGEAICAAPASTFALGGDVFALGNGTEIRIWNATNLSETARIQAAGTVSSLLLSTDGATLIVSSGTVAHARGTSEQVQVWALRGN